MYVALFILVFVKPNLAQFEAVDDIFESYIGNKHDHRRIITPKTFMADSLSGIDVSQGFSNGTHTQFRIMKDEMKLSKMDDRVIPQPTISPLPDIPIQHLKHRLRKIYLKNLVETESSPIPDFSKDGDDPAIITRRFQKINKQLQQQKKTDLRQLYFDTEYWDIPRLKSEKKKSIDLMSHFVYAIRYKLPYLQLLRKKYKHLHKYKIGYCFGLLRTLTDQQHIIYSSLHFYNMNFSNLMIHMKLYEKVVRLDVDIQDLAKYIRVLNYRKHIAADPDYYEENSEEMRYAEHMRKLKLLKDYVTPVPDGPTTPLMTTTTEPPTTASP